MKSFEPCSKAGGELLRCHRSDEEGFGSTYAEAVGLTPTVLEGGADGLIVRTFNPDNEDNGNWNVYMNREEVLSLALRLMQFAQGIEPNP